MPKLASCHGLQSNQSAAAKATEAVAEADNEIDDSSGVHLCSPEPTQTTCHAPLCAL